MPKVFLYDEHLTFVKLNARSAVHDTEMGVVFSNYEYGRAAVNHIGHYNAKITSLHVIEHSREDMPSGFE